MVNTNKLFYTKFLPKGKLKRVLKYGWIMKSSEVERSTKDLLIPDGYPEIIFVLNGAYCKENINQKTKAIIIEKSCFVGIQSESIFASRLNQCYLIGLKLYPWSAFSLFRDKLKHSTNKNISIDDFGVDWLCELNNQLNSQLEELEIVDLIFDALNNQLNKQKDDKESKEAEAFLRTILKKVGQISVKELADNNFFSLRHFQRKFKKYYGISPKKLINIIRFKHLYKSIVIQKKSSLSFLDFGYYDQMHFIKDFRKQLGTTPSNIENKAFLKKNEMAKLNL